MASERASQLLLGLVLSLAIGLVAYRQRMLSGYGVVGAVVTGTLTFGMGGWLWGWLLVVFFVSSSLLSRYRSAEKAAVQARFAKGGRRDLGQVLANGGVGALLALIAGLTGAAWTFPAYLGTLAAVNADTWATELGVLSRQRPRLITTGQVVPAGTSGGVTVLGTTAALAGGLLIGLAAVAWVGGALAMGGRPPADLARWPWWTAAGGLVGTFVDSVLGATVQRVYYCERCNEETERPVHTCGAATRRRRGWGWLTNDVVNLFSSLAGGLIVLGLAQW